MLHSIDVGSCDLGESWVEASYLDPGQRILNQLQIFSDPSRSSTNTIRQLLSLVISEKRVQMQYMNIEWHLQTRGSSNFWSHESSSCININLEVQCCDVLPIGFGVETSWMRYIAD